MDTAVGTLTAVAGVGLILTKLVDTLRNMFDGPDAWPKWVWNLLSLGLGVGAALVWGLDATNLGVADNDLQAWAGQVLTGLGIGATASGWHEVLDNISAGATAKRAGTLAPALTAVQGEQVMMVQEDTAPDVAMEQEPPEAAAQAPAETEELLPEEM